MSGSTRSQAPERQPKPKARRQQRKTRTPEPKQIISGAGHPLDPAVRRDLETRLGHDFSQVRVHTDRDSAALTDLVGADAVTVGQDVFFAEGAFRPGTEDGRRLLAHELLHTVQAPNPLGALRAGRDFGGVSLPQDPIEREAEQGARSGPGPQPGVTPEATPGWLRYAKVNADQYRTERLDPATLVDRLTAGILRSLRGDPTDAAGRVRQQLDRFAPELQDSVLGRLELRLPSSDYERVLELVDDAEHGPAAANAAVTPEPVTDAAERTGTDRDREQQAERGDHEQEQQHGEDKKQEQEQKKDKEPEDGSKQPDDSEKKQQQKPEDEQPAQQGAEPQPQPQPQARPQAQPRADGEAATAAAQPQPAETLPVAAAVGAPERESRQAEQQPVAGAKPQEPGDRQAPQPAQVKPDEVDRIVQAKDSPLVQHGLLDDGDKDDPREEEQPLGLEAGAGSAVEAVADDDKEPQPAPAEPELKPEDFLPSTDLDVSNVPTAEGITLSPSGAPPAAAEAPSFPEPPATKAEQTEAGRENEPEDEEAPAAPAAEAEDRTAKDLQPEQPVEAEVGPDPETAPETAPTTAVERDEHQEDEPREAEQQPQPATSAAAAGPVGAGTEPAAPVATPTTAPIAAPGPAAEQADTPGMSQTAPAPDASLEAGGGACAGPQQPTTEADKPEGGAGGCGGGGGGQAKQEEKPAPPDVSGQDPQSALATAAALPPDQMQSTLDGVDGSVDRTVGEQHAELQAAPPTEERPAGAPRTQHGPPEAAAPAEAVTGQLERVGPEGAEGDQTKAEDKKVEGRNPAEQVRTPNVADDASNQVTAQDVENMQGAVNEVPSTDPALNVTVGAAPAVELTGESDPKRTDEQSGKLQDKSARILGVGRDDSAKPMGEDRIYPDVPHETLKGTVPGGESAGGGRPTASAAGPKPGVAAVAQQERGTQIQGSVGQAQGRMGTEQAEHKRSEAEQRQQNQTDVDQATADNAEAQAGERGSAAEAVKGERAQWRKEQDDRISESDTEAGKEHTDKNEQILKKRTDTDKDVKDRQSKDNEEIQNKRKEAEDKARKEKDRKKEESSGWWGWVKSKVKAAFDALVSVVTGIFDFFRGLVNGIINKFREFANWAIDQARKLAVDLINKLADALIRICDVLLAAFPELRDRFRKKIEEWRDKAIAKVNEWADKLKAAVNKLLDALAAGLNALLNALEAGLKAAINAVRDAVVAAIDFAQKAIAAFAQFAALVGDIAADPGAWLSNLGASASQGVQNHLWGAIKTAVRTWFNEKVESVVGLTSTLVNILVKGCISLKQIGRMAWQAIVAALPGMIISIVIEKLVSLIVPAAGAIMTIIQGLMAAWNTISKIIAAFGKFFTFLKAVKAGPAVAACLFADAVAAGVVALLDFITNFLLTRLKSAGKSVGTKLKSIAQRIMKGLAKAGKGARKAVGSAVNRARTGLRNAAAALRGPRGRQPALAGHPSPRTRPGPTRRPGDHRPADRGPRREHESTKPREPQTAQPKPTRPRPPVSRTGQALKRAKGAVKGALKKVGNAARALGRKLKNSKLGRALTSSARKMRDAFRRQRDRLREWNNKRRQRRDDRRKHENSPESKEKRLALIVSRIRPRLANMLRRGVRGGVLSLFLGGLRRWYRLSSLRMSGERSFNIEAVLNPGTIVVAGVEVNEERILRFIRELAEEIIATSAGRGNTSGMQPVNENRIVSRSDNRSESIPVYDFGRGTNLAGVLDVARRMPYQDDSHEILRYRRTLEVWREQQNNAEQDTANKLISSMTGGSRGGMRLRPKYSDFVNFVKRNTPRGRDAREQLARNRMAGRVFAGQALDVLRGRLPVGPYRDQAAAMATLMVVQEGERDASNVVNAAMSLQIMRRTGDVESGLGSFPMAITGSQRGSRTVSDYLAREARGDALMDTAGAPAGPGAEAAWWRSMRARAGRASRQIGQMLRRGSQPGAAPVPAGNGHTPNALRQARDTARAINVTAKGRSERLASAEQVMRKESLLLQAWARTLDLKVGSSADEEARIQELFSLIRRRMYGAYNL